jgi:uroporphyrinogen-III synthase
MAAPLEGVSVVVTRAREQASALVERLVEAGATPVEIPLIAIAPPADRGDALRDALSDPARYDWVVVTSPNGVDALVTAAPSDGLAGERIAVVGPGTAARLRSFGIRPAIVPERFVAEGLLEAFPKPPADHRGRVLVAQADRARPVLVDGLRSAGWHVDAVVAYRTIAAPVEERMRSAVATADVVTFASASTVERFVESFGVEAVPRVVACIGPVTAEAARLHGIAVSVVAEPHTIDGLVAAVVRYVTAAGDRPR